MTAKIETVCIWCPNAQERIAEARALGRLVSHGICDPCKAKHFPNRVRTVEPLSIDEAQVKDAAARFDEADAAIERAHAYLRRKE